MGIEGLTELVKFVQAGGTLITEGSTTTILPDYGITTQVTVEHPTNLYAKGALMRGIISDKAEPHRLRLHRQSDARLLQPGPRPERRGGGGFRAARCSSRRRR